MSIYFFPIYFQESATPLMEGIVDLHNLIFFYLILIFIFVIWMFGYIIYKFYILPTILDFLINNKQLNILKFFIVEKYMSLYLIDKYKTQLTHFDILKYFFILRSEDMQAQYFEETLFKAFYNKLKVEGMVNQINLLKSKEFIEDSELEIIWTLIPSLILILIAVPSFSLLYAMDEIIDPKLTIKAIGYQWFWVYEYVQIYNKLNFDYLTDILGYNYIILKDKLIYDSIMISDEDLPKGYHRLLDVDKQVILPVNIHIRVLVTATDVLHSWAVPALGIKIDAVPGRLNQIELFLKREGIFYGQCSELCGVNHGFMPIAIKAVSYNEFMKWYEKININWN